MGKKVETDEPKFRLKWLWNENVTVNSSVVDLYSGSASLRVSKYARAYYIIIGLHEDICFTIKDRRLRSRRMLYTSQVHSSTRRLAYLLKDFKMLLSTACAFSACSVALWMCVCLPFESCLVCVSRLSAGFVGVSFIISCQNSVLIHQTLVLIHQNLVLIHKTLVLIH